MAKIIIEVEDIENGNVRVIATPNFETMAKMDLSGDKLTPAHGYALAMLNKVRQVSKANAPTNLIHIPRLGRS